LPSRPEKSEILREIKIKAVMEGFDLSHKQLGNLYKSVLEIFNSLPKHRQTIANMNALINNAFTDMAKNAKKASDSTKSLADGFIKLNGAALHGVKNILALGFGFTTISSSLKGGVSAVENYNNSLVAVSGSFKKYGMGVIETEGRIKGLGKTLNMTQGDVLKFFSAYEKGFRSFSAGGFEKMMVNIQKAVGLSTDAQNEMLGSLSQLSAKIPELQGSIERLDASDKKRIGTMTKLMLLSGKMSLQEYKSSQTYLKSSLLISTADKKREAELKKNQEAFAKLKIASEKFMLAIGKALMPIMVKFADSIDKIAPEVEKFFNKMESFVTSAVQNWDQLKDIIVAIGVAAASIKLGAMAMKLGTGAVSLAGGLAAGMGMGMGGGGIGAAGRGYASRVAGRGAYGANGLMAYGIGYGVTQASESMKSSARAKKNWGAERGAAGVGLGGSALKIGGLAATGFMFGGPAGAAIGAAIGGITEAGNIFNNAVTIFEDSATKIARAVKTREKDEEDVKEFKKDSKAQYEKTQTSMIFAKAEEKKMAEEIEKARQYGKDSINDPVKRKELEKRGKESEAGLTLANQEFEKSQESRVTTLNLSGGDDKRSYSGSSEARISAMEESKARLSMDLSNAQAGIGEDAKSDGFINALENDIKLLSKSIEDVEKEGTDASKSFVSGGKTLAEWNIELAKSEAALEEITTAEEVVVRKAQQQKAVTEAITGSLLEQSEVAAMTGRIVEEDLLEGFKKITAEMDTEMGLLNDKLSILKKTAETTSTEDKKLEAYKVVQADIANTEKEISGIFTRKVNLASQLGDKYKYQLSLVEKQTSLLTQMVSLADSFAIGVGASADMRMMAVDSMEKEIGLLEKEKSIRLSLVENAIADNELADDIIPLRQQVLETEGKILQKKIQQAEQTKVLRDGWISALGAMNTGAGRFTKILITQQQNLQSSLKLGGVVSTMSGALGGGYTRGSQFSAQSPGVINPEQGGVGGGAFAYNTTIPQNGAFGIQEIMRNRTAADAVEYANNALDHANGANGANSDRRRYEGQAAIDQPYVLSAMQDGARQTGRNQQGQRQTDGQRKTTRVRGFVPTDRKSGADWRDGESFANGTRYINNEEDGSRNYDSGITGVGINVQTGNTRDGINVLPMPKEKSSWPAVGPSGSPTSPIADPNPSPSVTPVADISVKAPELGKDAIVDAKNRITELDIKAKTGGYDKESQEKLAKKIAEEIEVRKGMTDSPSVNLFDTRIKEKEELLKQKQGSYNAPDESGMSRKDWQDKIKRLDGSYEDSHKGWNKDSFATSEEASKASKSTEDLINDKKFYLEKTLVSDEQSKNWKEKSGGASRLKYLDEKRQYLESQMKDAPEVSDYTRAYHLGGGGAEGVRIGNKGKGEFSDEISEITKEMTRLENGEGINNRNNAISEGAESLIKDIAELTKHQENLKNVEDTLLGREKVANEQKKEANRKLIDSLGYGGKLSKDALKEGGKLVKDALKDGAKLIKDALKEKNECTCVAKEEASVVVLLPTARGKEAPVPTKKDKASAPTREASAPTREAEAPVPTREAEAPLPAKKEEVEAPSPTEKEEASVPTVEAEAPSPAKKEEAPVVLTAKEKKASGVPTTKEEDFQNVNDAKDDWYKSYEEVKRIKDSVNWESNDRKRLKDFQENNTWAHVGGPTQPGGQKELTELSIERTNKSRQLLSEEDPGARDDLESSITNITERIDELNKRKEEVTKKAARWDKGGDMKKYAESLPEAEKEEGEKYNTYRKSVSDASDKWLSPEEKEKKKELKEIEAIAVDHDASMKKRDSIKNKIEENKQQESDARRDAKYFQENDQKELTELSTKRTGNIGQLFGDIDSGTRKDLESSIASMTERIDELNKTKEKLTKNVARWDDGGDKKKEAEANLESLPSMKKEVQEKYAAYYERKGAAESKYGKDVVKTDMIKYAGGKDTEKWDGERRAWNQEEDVRKEKAKEADELDRGVVGTEVDDAAERGILDPFLSGQKKVKYKNEKEARNGIYQSEQDISWAEAFFFASRTGDDTDLEEQVGGFSKNRASDNFKIPGVRNSETGKPEIRTGAQYYADLQKMKLFKEKQENALKVIEEQEAPMVRKNAERGLDPNYKARYDTRVEKEEAMKGTKRSIDVQEYKMGNKSEADELLGASYAGKGEDQKILDGLKELYKKQNVAEIGFLEEEKKATEEFKDALKEGADALKDGVDGASEKMTDFVTDPVKNEEIKEQKAAAEGKKAARDADMVKLMKNAGKKAENTDPDYLKIVERAKSGKKAENTDPDYLKIVENSKSGKKAENTDPDFLKMMQNAGKTPTMDEEIDNSPFLRMKYDSGSHIASEGEKFSAIPKLDTGGTIEETGLAVVHKGETVVPAGSGGDKSGIQLSIGQIVVHLEAGELDMLPSMIASAINSKLSSNPAARSIYSGGRSEAGGMVNGGGRTFVNAP